MPVDMTTPTRVVEDARLLLRTVRDEVEDGRRPYVSDIRRLVERGLALRFQAYVQFLERYGFLTLDRRADLLAVTRAGEAVITGLEGRLKGLEDDARYYFGDQLQDAPAPKRRSTGVRLDTRYLRHESIGRGGLGRVWRGRLLSVDRPVAIKMLDAIDDMFRPDQRERVARRFERAVREHAQLISPYIVQILDQNAQHDPPYFVMELAPGGNLKGLLERGPLQAPVALRYFIQIALGLKAAHAAGVVHRDLKPENVLLDAVGNVKLSDFGVTRVAERDGATMRRAYVGYGSVGYMAPELLRGEAEGSPASDVYALGILLYEMLTGSLPGRRSPLPSEVVEGLPTAVDDIFDRMARDDIDGRLGSIDAVLDAVYGDDSIRALLDVRGAPAFIDPPLPLPGLPEGELPEGSDEDDERDLAPTPPPAAARPPEERLSSASRPPERVSDRPVDRPRAPTGREAGTAARSTTTAAADDEEDPAPARAAERSIDGEPAVDTAAPTSAAPTASDAPAGARARSAFDASPHGDLDLDADDATRIGARSKIASESSPLRPEAGARDASGGEPAERHGPHAATRAPVNPRLDLAPDLGLDLGLDPAPDRGLDPAPDLGLDPPTAETPAPTDDHAPARPALDGATPAHSAVGAADPKTRDASGHPGAHRPALNPAPGAASDALRTDATPLNRAHDDHLDRGEDLDASVAPSIDDISLLRGPPGDRAADAYLSLDNAFAPTSSDRAAPFAPDRPSGAYAALDHPHGAPSATDRPSGPLAVTDRPSGPLATDRPSGPLVATDRPSGPHPATDRPSGPLAATDRPSGPYPATDRADRPSGPLATTDRPSGPHPATADRPSTHRPPATDAPTDHGAPSPADHPTGPQQPIAPPTLDRTPAAHRTLDPPTSPTNPTPRASRDPARPQPRAPISTVPRPAAPRPRATATRSGGLDVSPIRDRISRNIAYPSAPPDFSPTDDRDAPPADADRTAGFAPINDIAPGAVIAEVGNTRVGAHPAEPAEMLDDAEILQSGEFEPLDVKPAAFDALPASDEDARPIPRVISAAPRDKAPYIAAHRTQILADDAIEIVDDDDVTADGDAFRTAVHGRKNDPEADRHRADRLRADRLQELEARRDRLRGKS